MWATEDNKIRLMRFTCKMIMDINNRTNSLLISFPGETFLGEQVSILSSMYFVTLVKSFLTQIFCRCNYKF